MEGPLQSPRQFSPGSRPLPDPEPKLGDWGCPLRRNFTLLDDSLLATINHASHQRPTQFSPKCCLKNTYFPAVQRPFDQLSESYASLLGVRNSRDNQTVFSYQAFYAFFITGLYITLTSIERSSESVPTHLPRPSQSVLAHSINLGRLCELAAGDDPEDDAR